VRRFAIALSLSFGLACLWGCGSSKPTTLVEVSLEAELKDLGDIYDYYTKQQKRPPAKYEDLSTVSAGAPVSAADGRVKVYWGQPLSASRSNIILAYELKAETAGGWVLMQDGKTIKQLSAAEFASAPKAGK
jgi:hypothetical protein